MKRYVIFLWIIFNKFLLGEIYTGDIYNFTQAGKAYKGTLNVKINKKSEGNLVRITPLKGMKILKVNGVADKNDVYSLENGMARIDFLYRGEQISNEVLDIAGITNLETGKTAGIKGKFAVDFREKGEIKIEVKNGMEFVNFDVKQLRKGVKSSKDARIDIKVKLDEKDIKNTRIYFEYPTKIDMAEGKLSVYLDDKSKKNSINYQNEKGTEKAVVRFIPTSKNHREEITITGNLKANLENIESGRYIGIVKVKASYEYTDFTVESSQEEKIIVRR